MEVEEVGGLWGLIGGRPLDREMSSGVPISLLSETGKGKSPIFPTVRITVRRDGWGGFYKKKPGSNTVPNDNIGIKIIKKL